jgi:hypothetical protein
MDTSFVVPLFSNIQARSDRLIVASGDDVKALRTLWAATSRQDLQSMRGFRSVQGGDYEPWWIVAENLGKLPDVWLSIVQIGWPTPKPYGLYVDRKRQLYVKSTGVASVQVYLTPARDMDHAVSLLTGFLKIETQENRLKIDRPAANVNGDDHSRDMASVSLEVARGLWLVWQHHTRQLAVDAEGAAKKTYSMLGATGDVVLIDTN